MKLFRLLVVVAVLAAVCQGLDEGARSLVCAAVNGARAPCELRNTLYPNSLCLIQRNLAVQANCTAVRWRSTQSVTAAHSKSAWRSQGVPGARPPPLETAASPLTRSPSCRRPFSVAPPVTLRSQPCGVQQRHLCLQTDTAPRQLQMSRRGMRARAPSVSGPSVSSAKKRRLNALQQRFSGKLDDKGAVAFRCMQGL